jgi:hypothetical protein
MVSWRHIPLLAFVWTGPLAAAAAPQKPITVVELFTSQGCSSCPPANANLAMLAETRADVIALSFGVTYWDQLGWKDIFASPQFTARQWAYAGALKHREVATPQIVINGASDLVGNRRDELEARIAAARPLGGPTIRFDPTSITITDASRPKMAADVWLVRYDPRLIQVPVRAGENGGRTLPHRNVVRQLVRLGSWNGGLAQYPLPAAKAGLRSVVLVQTAGAGPIIAAALDDGRS